MPRHKTRNNVAPDSNDNACSDLELSEAQQRILVELTLGRSISAAATSAGVHRGTVHRWMTDDPLFAAAYNGWASEARSSAQSRFLAISDLAVDNICDAVRKGDTSTSLIVVKQLGLLTPVQPGPSNAEELARELDIAKRRKEADAESRSSFADIGL